MTESLIVRWHQEVEDKLEDRIVGWRRYLHRHPELSFEEKQTAAFIAAELEKLELEVRTGVGGGGVLGVLRGSHPGATIALRADFDALPIQDEKQTEYASTVPGVMHACGHDGHTASLLGVASLLSEQREQLHGTVVFLFQHAEEKTPGGAQAMIADGCLHDVDAVFGIHLSTELPVGQIGFCSGSFMAAADAFTIQVEGRGGHAARPHETVDSIAIACSLVGQLQHIVSRRVDPMQPAVVSIGKIQGGTAFNVIAEKTLLEGTVRTFDPEARDLIEQELRGIADGVARASHASIHIDYLRGYPTLVNHDKETSIVREAIADTMPDAIIKELERRMGAEDFAYYLQHKPGSFFYVGARGADERTHYPHHHPRFDIDERALVLSAKAFLSIVGQYLTKPVGTEFITTGLHSLPQQSI
ncbi:M20 metallopeptidase family protein [Cohnella terricola]|uniref:Amidohydrolase n=1 Tax=Cohnella terricola TaxID=1289167 RepID=A0A559JT64_9BACL|nr:amidohydrolase [Cohnella terricola]TVY03073.1 amidohydrolase [Cohnella terricola]